VSREHEVRGHVLDPGQRLDRLCRVGGERGDARTAGPRRDRVGRERIADQERAERPEVEHGAARRVTGREGDDRAPGYVEGRAVTERRDLTEVPGPKAATQQ
jgi:hypothetical protein